MDYFRQLFKPVLIAILFVGLSTASSFAQQCNIVVDAATLSHDGIVKVPGLHGATAFALSTTNIGTTCNISVVATAFFTTEPPTGLHLVTDVSVTLCQTNPQTGACLSPPGDLVSLTFPAGAQPTFSVFVQASGEIPPNSCVFVYFDNNNNEAGSISLPLETV